MQFLKGFARFFFILGFFFIYTIDSWSLTENVQQLVHFETKANAVALRSEDRVAIPHFEIPYEWVETWMTQRVPEAIFQSLVFEKHGVKFVRWILNPEDTKWHKDVAHWLVRKYNKDSTHPMFRLMDRYNPFLKSHHQLEKHYYFYGYQTASRSYIIEDPVSHSQFSLKASTDKTGGHWTDKKQHYDDAKDILNVSKYLSQIQKNVGFKYFFLMEEPMAIGIKELDQAIVVRLLNELPQNPKVHYLPGFSALHEEVGREIASRNGSNDPAEFWTQNYIIPMGRVIAELAAKTGITYDSPHSQNFVIELDDNYKPTGRIGLRDFGDVYLNQRVLLINKQKSILDTFSAQKNIRFSQYVSFGPLHGNQFPSWVSESLYDQWGHLFFKSFFETYSQMTGVPLRDIEQTHQMNGKYFSTAYTQSSEQWTNYFDHLIRQSQKVFQMSCRGLFGGI